MHEGLRGLPRYAGPVTNVDVAPVVCAAERQRTMLLWFSFEFLPDGR